MRRALPLACALALGAVGGVLLGGCGGGTKTVTASGAPTASAGVQAGAHTSSTAPTASTASTPAPRRPPRRPQPALRAQANSPSTTRTAPAPAFVTRGTVRRTSRFHRSHGRRGGRERPRVHGGGSLRLPPQPDAAGADRDAHGLRRRLQPARLLLPRQPLPRHRLQPSPAPRCDVVGQSDTEVILAYALYRPHDSLCCPSGGLGHGALPAQQRPARPAPADPARQLLLGPLAPVARHRPPARRAPRPPPAMSSREGIGDGRSASAAVHRGGGVLPYLDGCDNPHEEGVPR